jgi:hypothetical protein
MSEPRGVVEVEAHPAVEHEPEVLADLVTHVLELG